jgi:prevent-host-death family protein
MLIRRKQERMKIISSAELRNKYRSVADEANETGEPVYITNNGEGELVVMSIWAYQEIVSRRGIERELRRIDAEKQAGAAEYVPYAPLEKREGKRKRYPGMVAETTGEHLYDEEV